MIQTVSDDEGERIHAIEFSLAMKQNTEIEDGDFEPDRV